MAGVFGMGLGGAIAAVLGRSAEKMTTLLLSFAGGVMTSIVFFEFMPEAIEYGGAAIAIIGLVLGVLVVMVLNILLDKVSGVDHNRGMIHTGIILIIAIGIHNVPEGMAIGAAGIHDISLGVTIAVLIALHNIPEGMAVAAPFMAGGVGRIKTVIITILCGTTTVIGALIGAAVGGVSDTTLAFCLAFAGGAMLYVVFGEILPQSVNKRKNNIPTLVLLFGIVVGLLITFI